MKIAYTRSSTLYDDSRATKELLALLERGNKVIALGWDRNGTAVQRCKEAFSEYESQVTFRFYSGSTGNTKIQKIVSRILWAKWLKRELNRIDSVDVIHTCDYDTGAITRKYAKKHNIKYIYDIFDYYIDAHPVPKCWIKRTEAEEIKVINDAACTIICTEERKEQIKKSAPKMLAVIHNSPDVNEIDINNTECQYDYVYCGSLYRDRLIGEILDAYPNNTNRKCIFAGYGLYGEKAEKLSEEYENFTFLGAIPYSRVIEAEKKSRVISALYNPSKRNHRLCAPNKFYEALALGKPLIVCRGTGIDKVVEKEKLGIVINYNAEEFFSALEYLCNNSEERKEMGLRGRALYEKKYMWSLMKQKLIEIYSNIQ